MINYKTTVNPYGESNIVERNVDEIKCCIPFDPDNQDFVQYQKWLSEGNTPIPADESNA